MIKNKFTLCVFWVIQLFSALITTVYIQLTVDESTCSVANSLYEFSRLCDIITVILGCFVGIL